MLVKRQPVPTLNMKTGTCDAEQIEEERWLLYVACTRSKDWLYVLFPLRYYHSKHRLGDDHGYAQLTRFIPQQVAKFFDRGAVAGRGEEEVAEKPPHLKNIRKSIRSMWD